MACDNWENPLRLCQDEQVGILVQDAQLGFAALHEQHITDFERYAVQIGDFCVTTVAQCQTVIRNRLRNSSSRTVLPS